jgi:signal transduction histidine kinase
VPERAVGLSPALLAGLAGLLLTAVPVVLGPPESFEHWVGAMATIGSGLSLAWWRSRPGLTVTVGPALALVALGVDYEPTDGALLLLLAFAAIAAERYGGRAAWGVAAAIAAYLALIYRLTGDPSIGLVMLTVPGWAAGTVLRLRRETAEELEERGRELEAERELLVDLSVRNERARIAAELHDIVGHALSAIVVQAAAGQRLVDRSPGAAAGSVAAIAESARQGRADLQRLVDLLGGTEVRSPDLSLVDEIVASAARAGLQVTCRLEGDRDGVASDTAHVAFRVVQESLTNAMRHAPGAPVHVLLRGEPGGRSLTVCVENDPAAPTAPFLGSGRGLSGLRERVLALGGSFAAGPAAAGGWRVEAHLPPAAHRFA